jgi:K+/H+ antiporter YhaU regulatory subunit KhtT
VSVDPSLKVLSVQSRRLRGKHPAELRIRDKTGCSVVAVERGEELLVEFGPDFQFVSEDVIHICGTVEATRRFNEIFPPRD